MINTRKYQNEKPIDTDLFEGQGHQQVAQAIASVLLSDSSQHIIGIEGNLGSGKSTVISILQQDIADKGFHVVTFDADQYQSTLKSALIQNIEAELEKMRIGELSKLSDEELLADININSAEVDVLTTMLPFTSQWNEPQNRACYQQLVNELESHIGLGSLDDATLNAYTALCAASLVNEVNPIENLTVRNHHGQNHSYQVAGWLSDKLNEQPDSSQYLTNYLSFCTFEKVLTWCKNSTVGSYLLPNLEELIKNHRIYRMNVSTLLTNDYVFLKDNCANLTPKEILNWMESWHTRDKEPLDWNLTVVKDIIQCESLGFLSVLTEYFDNPSITKEEWLERIKVDHLVFREIAYYLHSKKCILEYQKPLQQALKELHENHHNYNLELVKVLTHLIDGNQRNGIRISLISAFFKTNTSLDNRYRIIRYFGEIISIPTINDSGLEMEAIALLDDAINKEHQDEKEWLLRQPLDGTGWNISEWSLDNLKALYSVLNDDPETKNDKLTKAVAERLNEYEDNDKTDSAA